MGILDYRQQMSTVPQSWDEYLMGLLAVPYQWAGQELGGEYEPVEGWTAPFAAIANAPRFIGNALGQAGQSLQEASEGAGLVERENVSPIPGPWNYRINQRGADVIGAGLDVAGSGILAKGLKQVPDAARGLVQHVEDLYGNPAAVSRVIAARPAGSLVTNLPEFRQAPEGLIPMPDQPNVYAPLPQAPGKAYTLTHWSNQPDLETLRAGQFGAGGQSPAFYGEAGRLRGKAGAEVRPRVDAYLGSPGAVKPEAGLGQYPHTFDAPGLYDIATDPEGIAGHAEDIARLRWAERNEYLKQIGGSPTQVTQAMINEDAKTLAEQLLRDEGYRGYVNPKAPQGPAAVLFEDVDLTGKYDTMAERAAIERAANERGLLDFSRMGEADEVGRAIGGDYPRYGGKGVKAGEYVGSPRHLKTTQALTGLTQRLKHMAQRGAPAMHWYDRDTQNLAAMSSGDIASAYPVADAIAITSPQQKVKGNAMEGLRAAYQRLMGEPYSAGRFGDEMGRRLTETMDDPAAALGRKRASFRGNLLKWWDEVVQGTTEDMQMARAARFPRDSLSDAQYDFLERTVARISDQLNAQRKSPTDPFWTPDRVQAAIWTAQKMDREGSVATEAGANLADAMHQANAYIPWEARTNANPSLATGWGDANTLYFNDAEHMLRDEWGNNVVAREMGLLQTPQVRGQGIWGAERNPNAAMRAPVPTARPKDIDLDLAARGWGTLVPQKDKSGREVGKTFKWNKGATAEQRYLAARMRAEVEGSARKALNATAVTNAGILEQEGAAWVHVMRGGTKPPAYAQNHARIDMPRWKRQDIDVFMDELEKAKARHGVSDMLTPVVPTETGLQAYRPMLEAMDEAGAAEGIAANKAFHKVVQEALDGTKAKKGTKRKPGEPAKPGARDAFMRSGYGEPEVEWGIADSFYAEAKGNPDWGIPSYYDIMEQAGPRAWERGEATYGLLRPAIERLGEWTSKAYPPNVIRNLAQRRRGLFGQQGLIP